MWMPRRNRVSGRRRLAHEPPGPDHEVAARHVVLLGDRDLAQILQLDDVGVLLARAVDQHQRISSGQRA